MKSERFFLAHKIAPPIKPITITQVSCEARSLINRDKTKPTFEAIDKDLPQNEETGLISDACAFSFEK